MPLKTNTSSSHEDTQLLDTFKIEYEVDAIILSDEYAVIGGTFNGEQFIPIAPYPSWTWNTELKQFVPPVPDPGFDGGYHLWNEDILNWEKIQESE